MRGEGLIPVEDPSHLFINSFAYQSPGSVVFPSREGTRPLLVEIQALVSKGGYSSPRRTVVGMDYNRAILVLAIVEKRLGLDLSSREVFISVAGGMTIYEPAADLAVSSVILSSYYDRPIKSKTVLFGELGLTGEVRGVGGAEERIKEAFSHGFEKIITPKSGVLRDNKISNLFEIENLSELQESIF
jgi:DNA repair protein RadA/Sms